MSLSIDIFSTEEEEDQQSVQEQAWQEYSSDYNQQQADDNYTYNPLHIIV